MIKRNEEELIEYKDQLNVTNNDLAHLNEEYDKLSKTCEEKNGQVINSKLEVDKLTQSNVTLQIENTNSNRKMADFALQLSKCNHKIETLSTENESQTSEMSKLLYTIEKS